MKIAVIGASGRSGRVFVQAALEAGHTVVAGTRDPSSIQAQPNLSVRSCNALDSNDVATLIEGCDAVVSLIGHSKRSPKDLHYKATQALIEAMRLKGLTRLVSLTGTGVRRPGDKITLPDRILTYGITKIDNARIPDAIQQQHLLEQSNLNWTMIRVVKLQGARHHPYHLTLHGPAQTFVSRQVVTSAILQTLEQHSFIRQAPIIGR